MNLLRDHTRTKKSRFWKCVAASAVDVSDLREQIPSRQQSPETVTLIQEQLKGVWNAMHRLSERQRKVFLMRYKEEMSLSEIARVTGLSIGMVKSSLHRGIKVLRSHCRSAGPPFEQPPTKIGVPLHTSAQLGGM
jgi:RNA polymerase sigma-70 factor (ECF subfamily)